MLYRCRGCGHEEARGCLPSVSCGLYFVGLLLLSTACQSCLVTLLFHRAGPPPVDVDPSGPPGWGTVLLVPVSLAVALVGAIILYHAFNLFEWLLFACRRCPTCRVRRWSWGYRRGVGL